MKSTTTSTGRKGRSGSKSPKNAATAGVNVTAQSKNGTTTITPSEQHSSLLEKLFIDMLKDTLWAEQYLGQALSTLVEAATTEELKEAFEDHQFITHKHVSRLERVFKMLGREAEPVKCEVMEALVKEAEKMISETKEGSMTRDAALIIAAQKVEHYEIATYGSLVQIALTLGHDEEAAILEKTLWDEEDTDKLLTEIAETEINPMADSEETSEGMESDDEDEEEDTTALVTSNEDEDEEA